MLPQTGQRPGTARNEAARPTAAEWAPDPVGVAVTWLATPFDGHDLADLARGAARVPGFAIERTGLAVVSLSGAAPGLARDLVDLMWGPDDVVSAWGA